MNRWSRRNLVGSCLLKRSSPICFNFLSETEITILELTLRIVCGSFCGLCVAGAGGPDAKWEDELGAPRVDFTRGAFDFVVPSFCPLSGSIATVRIKPPRVKRSCEKTCLVRSPAIWGWSEMSIRLSKIALRASIEEIPKREKLQNREGGFFHSFNRRVGHPIHPPTWRPGHPPSSSSAMAASRRVPRP